MLEVLSNQGDSSFVSSDEFLSPVGNRSTGSRQGSDGFEKSQICIVNTHLYSNHLYPDVKLWQTVALLRELENFVTQRDLPFILAGDFNSEPHSAVYQFLTEGGINSNHGDLENVSDKMIPGLESSRHSLGLVSVMHLATGQEPVFTNYTENFRGTLDYILFNPNRLRLTSFVAIPEESELKYCGFLPNAVFASDHFYLCCDFVLASAVKGNATAASIGASSRSSRRLYSGSPPPNQAPNSAQKGKTNASNRISTR